MRYFFFVFFVFFLASCSGRLSEISFKSNVQEGDSISVALYSKRVKQYTTVNGTTVTSTDVVHNSVSIPLPDSLMRNIRALSITIHGRSDSIFSISSVCLKGYGVIYPQELEHARWWYDGLKIVIDRKTNTINNYIGIFAFFIRFKPQGIHLFIRFSLLTALIVLIFFFCKQVSSQRFLLFTIALFLASLPLKIDYTIFTMSFMGVAILGVFIRFLIFDFRFLIHQKQEKQKTCIEINRTKVFCEAVLRRFAW